MDQPPLHGRYGMAVAIALLGLCPTIVLTTAAEPLTSGIAHDLAASPAGVRLAGAMSNAGYALGAVVAAQMAQRWMQRRLFLAFEAAFVVGSVLATLAPGLPVFFAGRVVQGLATGLMLVSALPPLVTRFGVPKLPVTVAIVNIGLFGATTLGPIVGGVVAGAGAWRVLLAITAVLGLAGVVVAALGYDRFPAPDPERPVDRSALGLAAVATFLPFFATSALAGHDFASPVVLVPFCLGIAALVALIVLERRRRDPLMPVRQLSTQLPVTGTVVAMVAGAVFITVLQLTQLFLAKVAHAGPVTAGLLFWPMPIGLVVASVVFGRLFATRWLPVLVVAGLVALGGGAALLLLLSPSAASWDVPVAALLLGLGAGATVSPGLFLAAMGVPSAQLGRAFALVELLRSEAGFAITPVVLVLAQSAASLATGVHGGLVAMLVLDGIGLLLALAIPALSGARLRRPDLHHWLDEGDRALPSPATAVHLRPGIEDDAAEPLLPRRRAS